MQPCWNQVKWLIGGIFPLQPQWQCLPCIPTPQRSWEHNWGNFNLAFMYKRSLQYLLPVSGFKHRAGVSFSASPFVLSAASLTLEFSCWDCSSLPFTDLEFSSSVACPSPPQPSLDVAHWSALCSLCAGVLHPSVLPIFSPSSEAWSSGQFETFLLSLDCTELLLAGVREALTRQFFREWYWGIIPTNFKPWLAASWIYKMKKIRFLTVKLS